MSQLLDDLMEMVRIPSVNPFDGEMPSPAPEEAMAQLYEGKLAALGLEVESTPVSHGRRNVWGRLKGSGSGPTIMLAGHMDTVGVEGYDGPFDPFIKDGKMHGRGACDMKAGLAAYLEVVRRLQAADNGLSGDLILAAVVDEEHAMTGSDHFGLNGPSIDHAIIAEPSELAICPVHKGQMCFGLRTKGVSVHSSLPHKGINAVNHMCRVVVALEDYAATLSTRTPHPMAGHPTLNIGTIRGGNSVSSVADWCTIDIDRRTIPGEDHEAVMAEIAAVVAGVAVDIPEMDYEFINADLDVPALGTPNSAPTVQALESATAAVLGAPSEIRSFSGSTDAPNFRCEAVICGPGALAQCHSLNEWVEVAQIEQAVEIYLHAIRALQPGH
ncbi:MAG: M20 family metallopeptidase [Alphaproteobacteria bacterium]|jgi:acetylornithine deacetylase/succinyl-diaminopimelate desuccinylase family protein|nr:M20 family metallopeptidase [Alphaproteobacteria bacterium]